MKNLLFLLLLATTLSQAQTVQKIEPTHWNKEVPRTYTVLVTENPFTFHSVAWILPAKEEVILNETIIKTEMRDGLKVFHISTVEKEEVYGYNVTLDTGFMFRTTDKLAIGEHININTIKDE